MQAVREEVAREHASCCCASAASAAALLDLGGEERAEAGSKPEAVQPLDVAAAVGAGGDASARLDRYIREKVTFLGPTFERDTAVTFHDVCSKGSI